MNKELLTINFNKRILNAYLKMVAFKEGDSYILYFPSLRISGYGDTKQEAFDLAMLDFQDFCDNLFKLQNEHLVYNELKSYGWKKNKYFPKKMNNLSKTTYEDIRREFNIPETTPIKEEMVKV